LTARLARIARSRRRLSTVLALFAGTLAFVLLGGPANRTQRAAGQEGAGEVTAQTDASVPARGTILIGSSRKEAPGETWGIGKIGSINNPTWTLATYREGAGWSLSPMLNASGQALAQFVPDESPLTGEVTASGAGALLGAVSETDEEGDVSRREMLLVRDPGGAFREVETVPSPLLGEGESLFAGTRAPLLAPLDEAGGRAGALVVPVRGAGSTVTEGSVLHWDGTKWTREPIEVPAKEAEGFRVLAIGASSPANAWLLGQLPGGGVALFRRDTSGAPSWKPVTPKASGVAGEALSANERPFSVAGIGEPPTVKAQILTVTEQGVWIDGERADVHAGSTIFFKPSGEGQDNGVVSASWCNIPEGAPAGTPSCTYPLAQSLPSGPSRSFAWADGSTPYGQRVITGLPEDVTLRLEGSSFARVLALGASESAALGAAFSEPRDGWLGDATLPVHLTLHPVASRLETYPVPFRFALLALAPKPGAPVGALTSEALAVGDEGEVARYTPGEGWEPEPLLGAGGRRSTARLRAVGWPIQNRAYPVGELGQMWLWRAETGLWEPDPAAPRNFRANLLGVAFDPTNPGRGYAVGQSGTLLRYGKTWTQEALPPEVAHASFTSVAFAGSEALVAYRIPQLVGGVQTYSGGLLVNSGSGWHVDPAAASALAGEGGVPWAVAGLPDGGAALSGETAGGEPLVLERGGQGAGWAPPPTPYPRSGTAPGSLALFREGGELRLVGSGAIPRTREIDFPEPPAPAGLPEILIKPYPPASGHVIRQTAAGWSDEEHDRNESTGTPGTYASWDVPFEPDPTAAVMVDPSGSIGWAVGGEIETVQQGILDTADIARYPADGVPPPGAASAPVLAGAGMAVFAIAGGAQCAAPCADRQHDGLGPDLWLSSALGQAAQIPGMRAFLDLGPRVTTGRTTSGKVTQEVPYAREFARYSSLLHGAPIATYPAASPTDLAGATGECLFREAFPEVPWAEAPTSCASSPQSAYYAFDSVGPTGTVRVIVLDEASSVGEHERTWLREQLEAAAARAVPAIVLGNADLNAQSAAREPAALAVASILAKPGGASAYFYDSPERNVQLQLRGGAESIPSFGTGTLGYVSAVSAARQDFVGHSGFLLAEVNASASARNPKTGRWPVVARLIPNVGELALEAEDGVLLHRSQQALFAGLARRPRAGCVAEGGAKRCLSSPYIPIPAECLGAACASGLLPEYSFSSSRPDIGQFVQRNLASTDPRAVLLGPGDKPIPNEKSGLFCAYNAGTTVVTISAGGLSSSLNVTVLAGSVRRPCGTQPLNEAAAIQSAAASPPAPAPAPAAAGPSPASSPTPVSPPVPPLPPAPPAPPAPAGPHPAPAAFFLPPVPIAPLLAFVPPPVPTPARPSPPTGTSAVTSPIEVAEREEEEEEATESVSNQAVAYRASDSEPAPEYLLGLIVLAALAGVTLRRRPRRGRRDVHVAAATVSTSRQQRRTARHRRHVNRW
jgi:hypothetical protein